MAIATGWRVPSTSSRPRAPASASWRTLHNLRGRGNGHACHLDGSATALTPGQRRNRMTPLRAFAGATILGIVVVFVHAACAQTGSSPVYFPYPPGVIPADLDQEIQRVQGEVDHIFQQALAQWRALPINEVPQNVNKTIGNLGLSA